MEESEVIKKISMIQYHQRLIVEMLQQSKEEFNKLIIINRLTELEVRDFHALCEKLNIELEEQKAEGFVYYHPLYQYFLENLNRKLKADEVIRACISQNLYLDLMKELEKYL